MIVEETTRKKTCPYCNTANEMDSQYCIHCGRKLIELRCRKCGAEITAGLKEKFCHSCGAKDPLSYETMRKVEEIGRNEPEGDRSVDRGLEVLGICVVLLIFFLLFCVVLGESRM